MENFALITEGITDQVVLESILCGYYEDDLEINIIQPARDATDESRQENFGGWEKVLEYCKLSAFKEIFLFNKYVVIQIDTDITEHVNFEIPHNFNGTPKTVPVLVNEVREKIKSQIDPDVFETFKDRIFFAIAVHSLECWLLPLYVTTPAAMKKTVNCEHSLSRAVIRADGVYKKEYREYEVLTKSFFKKKNVLFAKEKNESLSIFLDSLPN